MAKETVHQWRKNKKMMKQIIRKFTAARKTGQITSEQVLAWARKVEVQILQKQVKI